MLSSGSAHQPGESVSVVMLPSAVGPPNPIDYLRGNILASHKYHQATKAGIPVADVDLLQDPAEAPDQKRPRYDNPMEEPPARERPVVGEEWPYRETLSFTRSLMFYGSGSITSESELACRYIQEARCLRQKYAQGQGTVVHGTPISLSSAFETMSPEKNTAAASPFQFAIGENGVAEVYHTTYAGVNLIQVPSIDEFVVDYERLVEICAEGAMRSFCFQRLQLLSSSFKMHTTINAVVEAREQSNLLGTDFYRVMKIDNHIHAAAAMSAQQFVKFVQRKLETESDTVVNAATGQTLGAVFSAAGLHTDHLTIDAFNVLADYSVYQRFDNFNSKYSPFRLADMRRIVSAKSLPVLAVLASCSLLTHIAQL
jgi:AMP deaminase